ncbi:hypothetical protein AZE42_08445 [Rhizopogon vesiculosus]|uniref:Uncharacterized protein n=1 Tax=Rhizopogon vesiculosus TaxID=180088 RepID=A0A1J8PFF7_9AGAM|nr:hypothetical protein AZE42_08445 [Rhizopogon vesiculosus]
MTINASKIIP